MTQRAAQKRSSPWPYKHLDVAQLRRDGWRPTPIRDLVLKVHQRCNLACDYCYVYEHADQSWRRRPSAMPEAVWRAAVTRLAEHVRTHAITHVRVILHGGEPLLFGASRLADLAADVRAQVPAECRVDVGVQTNGVLLSASVMRTLRENRIAVGVSVDGSVAAHDRHRPYTSGRGSYAMASKALDLLRQSGNRDLYAGILCVVSPESDPLACYDQLVAFEPPVIDFLLPHANWQRPPVRPDAASTPSADWLVTVFDRWYDTKGPVRIRLFEDILSLVLGGSSQSEQVGLSPAAILVVESDGAIEQVDALKTAYDGACSTGLDVRHDSLDAALDDPGVVARQLGIRALSAQCRACPIVEVCGGGHYAHRYAPGRGFQNPSVYCEDMKVLIGHVSARIRADLERVVASTP
jgi:uncharacterized protein